MSDSAFDEVERQRLRQELGSRIKSLRQERGLTLERAALNAGIAASTIYKIEAGKVSPSFENLMRIAHGFRVGIEQLFAAATVPSPTRLTVTRKGEGKPVRGRLYHYEILCNALAGKRIIPMMATIENQGQLMREDFDSPDGEQTIFVREGRVELCLEHYEPVILEPGDCAYFDSKVEHALRALDAPARVFWACTHIDATQ